MGKGSFSGEVLTPSGILKCVEILVLVVTIGLHRIGDYGRYIFFGTLEHALEPYEHSALNLENMGNAALVSYAIIVPALLTSYIVDGRFAVQSLFLEPVWNLWGAILFMYVGIKSMIVWHDAEDQDYYLSRDDTARNYLAAQIMCGLCIFMGILLFIDFVVSVISRKQFLRAGY